MSSVFEFEITRILGDEILEVRDCVAVEHPLSLYVNGEPLVEFSCTPSDLEALVLGFLCTKGFVESKDELQDLSILGSVARATLKTETFEYPGGFPRVEPCVSRVLKKEPLPHQVFMCAGSLFDTVAKFNVESSLFASTGGVHSCGLYFGNSRVFAEDVGRHNAFDKVIGKALLRDWDITQSYLLTSGRISKTTVTKALRIGLPILVSLSAPTSAAVELARKANMTLCGFARGRRTNVYSACCRILPSEIAAKADRLKESRSREKE